MQEEIKPWVSGVVPSYPSNVGAKMFVSRRFPNAATRLLCKFKGPEGSGGYRKLYDKYEVTEGQMQLPSQTEGLLTKHMPCFSLYYSLGTCGRVLIATRDGHDSNHLRPKESDLTKIFFNGTIQRFSSLLAHVQLFASSAPQRPSI